MPVYGNVPHAITLGDKRERAEQSGRAGSGLQPSGPGMVDLTQTRWTGCCGNTDTAPVNLRDHVPLRDVSDQRPGPCRGRVHRDNSFLKSCLLVASSLSSGNWVTSQGVLVSLRRPSCQTSSLPWNSGCCRACSPSQAPSWVLPGTNPGSPCVCVWPSAAGRLERNPAESILKRFVNA